MSKFEIQGLDFKKMDGLIPAVIQDVDTRAVLMIGFMNEEALAKTLKDKKVTFWSRTKKKLWQKGEESGNYLHVESFSTDCDRDSLLVKVKPGGPTCHTGDYSCFEEETKDSLVFLKSLFELIRD
jgi:phosphoribosyl-ATP pyrophosphohydrolase/phosphoribosyl-AMP cyclohydrolase